MGENLPTVGTEGHGGQFVVSVGLREDRERQPQTGGLCTESFEGGLVFGRQEGQRVGGPIPVKVDLRVVCNELPQGVGRLHGLIPCG